MTDTSIAATLPASSMRRRQMIGIGGVLVAVGVAGALWYRIWASPVRSTDDAYVNGHVVVIASQVPGSVSALMADNADRIEAGQALVVLDPSDARIELASAQAGLEKTLRRVRELFAAEAQSATMIGLRQAELSRVQADLRARQDLVGQGAVTAEDARHALDAVKVAQAALDVARQTHAQALAQTQGTDVDHHPAVREALERIRAAALALERSTVRAPVSGMVAQRRVQLGTQVAVGDRLMAVVPLDQVWIDANFKEVQLEGVCSGQPARVTADVYGKRVVYHGRVEDVEAGSGAAFALLPAQNASGNWIKVVQRVPVRIRLEAEEVAKYPLRLGLSTRVTVDTRTCLSDRDLRRTTSVEQTSIFTAQQSVADQRAAMALVHGVGAKQ